MNQRRFDGDNQERRPFFTPVLTRMQGWMVAGALSAIAIEGFWNSATSAVLKLVFVAAGGH